MPDLSPAKRRLATMGFAVAAPLLLFLLADVVFPLPLDRLEPAYTTLVVAEDGTPLRVFPGTDQAWRYPTTLEQVSPRFVEALIQYEDRWFHQHPGINPLALLRAAWQNLRHGRVISGGSTITMQVARLVAPHQRTVAGKLAQMFRALQLEWHLDKQQILTLYLNHAPYGGIIEGVEAASLTYLGKSAAHLTHAEAALLAVLPQSPTRLRPDRNPQQAQAARDKVLDRLRQFGVWDADTVADAKMESVQPWRRPQEFAAPLLARRLRLAAPDADLVRTTIDIHLQRRLEEELRALAGGLPPRASLAVLVVENATLAARAYAGSADFLDADRFGHVDMVTAVRSPGSTLKPFLYGFALDDGLIHSESLLADVQTTFDGYRPGNFGGDFTGPVSVADALRRSLNIPAVDLLDRMDPNNFDARLRNGGFDLHYPGGARPNLAMILGGVGATLEQLVGAYSSLGREGMAGQVRYRPEQPLHERRMLSPGAAWIVREILRDGRRPGLAGADGLVAPNRGVAWKTGTSYGFRDAWAVGVTDRYTIGIWVGRPDGTPLPGHYGAATAAPILFSIVDMLPRSHLQGAEGERPASVSRVTVCWPLGTAAAGLPPGLCHDRRNAWVLGGVIPPTLPDRLGRPGQSGRIRYWVNPTNGKRVVAGCAVVAREERDLARWPIALQRNLPQHWRDLSRLPPLDPACRHGDGLPSPLRLIGHDGPLRLRRANPSAEWPLLTFEAAGGEGRLVWLLDGAFVGETNTPGRHHQRFDRPGEHTLMVLDQIGNSDAIAVEVDE